MGITVGDICDLMIDNCDIKLFDVATGSYIFEGTSEDLKYDDLSDLEVCTIDLPEVKYELTLNVDTSM